MSSRVIFLTQLALGYGAWLLFFGAYAWPWLKSMDRVAALRVIAIFHSFRFFGLIFILPGFVGANLPAGFASVAAYGDFATGLLAMLALLAFRMRTLFWVFTIAYNVVGAADILIDYYHGVQIDIGAIAGQFGAGYAIVILYVPALMITHVVAFYFMIRKRNTQGAAA